MGGRTGTGKIRCLITGKMVPKPQEGVDLINPKPVRSEVAAGEAIKLAHQMADMRQEWAGMTPSDRHGSKGMHLATNYRSHKAKFKELTGRDAPPIYADQ